ncbi:hypothetical protein HPB51_022114 [Rhipicephalus microplus]|uniref:Uncharacterized protein n=1 Tax=Rhipicephalus microplus TaxID=6941 RepID=A0A9J6EC69_RHIMP|nr:hypothetical protein HPB51_022114 [Rhipicephalus microplus]
MRKHEATYFVTAGHSGTVVIMVSCRPEGHGFAVPLRRYLERGGQRVEFEKKKKGDARTYTTKLALQPASPTTHQCRSPEGAPAGKLTENEAKPASAEPKERDRRRSGEEKFNARPAHFWRVAVRLQRRRSQFSGRAPPALTHLDRRPSRDVCVACPPHRTSAPRRSSRRVRLH